MSHMSLMLTLGVMHSLAEQKLPQAEHLRDDGTNHEAAIACATALDAPHVIDVGTEGHASPGRRAGCHAARPSW